MTKDLHDLAWSVLPKEFKEEVKERFTMFVNEKNPSDCSYGYLGLLIKLFGVHNLTSDAEGEDEMLFVSRKKIQEVYRQNKEEINRENVSSSDKDCYETVNEVLKTLFDSKCLPNEEAQPKFHKGDRVKVITDCWKDKVYTVTDVKEIYPQFSYKLSCSPDIWYAESTLELYTESIEDKAEKIANKVINPMEEHFDTILKDNFSKEKRQNIAVQLTCAIIPKYQDNGDGYGLSVLNEKDMIKCAYRLADILIAESEKKEKRL